MVWALANVKDVGKSITKDEQCYPTNMALQWRGPSGFYNLKTYKYIEKEGNIHFHLNIQCLHGKSISIEECHTIIYNDMFCKLDHQQMAVLKHKGFFTSHDPKENLS